MWRGFARHQEYNHATVGKKEITIDVSDLNGGIYFAKVQSEKGSAVRKLVVE